MLRIFDRYLLKEVILGWLAVSVVLWLILVSDRLVRYLAEAAEGNIPAALIFELIAIKMVGYLVTIMPFALALGVVLALGRLYRDSEMVVMAACGVGHVRIYRPLLAFGLLLAAVMAWLSLYVSPGVEGLGFRLKASAQQQAEFTVLGAGRFNELQGGRLTFYAEQLSDDRTRMQNLFILVREPGLNPAQPVQVITAQSARRVRDADSGDDFLVLQDGYRYEGQPGAADYRVMQFGRYGMRVDLPEVSKINERLESMPTRRLLRSTDPGEIAELQWRIALPLSVISLLILAVPLCRSGPREGRYARLVVAILLFVIYYNLLGTARAWVSKGDLPPQVGLWWVLLLPILVAALLFRGRALACRLGLRR